MKRICISLLSVTIAATAARANMCGLPVTSGAGAGVLTGPTATLTVIAGLIAGVAQSTNVVLAAGFQPMSDGAYTCFLSTDTPLAVQAFPGTLSVQRLVPSAGRVMTLEWTNSFAINPVSYTVNLGTNPLAMSEVASGIVATNLPLSNLSYTPTVYSWQVMAADQFGRFAMSNIYTFSIAPPTDHLIAAPNPMHPGHGMTTFLFNMPGVGSATMDIYSLPDARHVFHQEYGGLQDGSNTIVYDGRENNGQFLPNGVFTVKLTKNGASGNATELFKLVSAR